MLLRPSISPIVRPPSPAISPPKSPPSLPAQLPASASIGLPGSPSCSALDTLVAYPHRPPPLLPDSPQLAPRTTPRCSYLAGMLSRSRSLSLLTALLRLPSAAAIPVSPAQALPRCSLTVSGSVPSFVRSSPDQTDTCFRHTS